VLDLPKSRSPTFKKLGATASLDGKVIQAAVAFWPHYAPSSLLFQSQNISLNRGLTVVESGCNFAASCHNSGFDSALYRKVEAKWHFSQENATSHDLQMATYESKPL
jgi:hypothetical protein